MDFKLGDELPYELTLKGGQIRFPAGHRITREILRMLREGRITKIELDPTLTSDDSPMLFEEDRPVYPDGQRLRNAFLFKKAREIIHLKSGKHDEKLSVLRELFKRVWCDQSEHINSDSIEMEIESWVNTIADSDQMPACVGWNTRVDEFFTAHLIDTLKLSVWFAGKQELPEREIRALAYAAVLHDTGELFINRQILLSPANLQAAEVNRIREHPRKSVEWMKRAGLGDELSQHIVLRHHERYDGSGYPYNLRGKMLEFADNILALADMFAALVSLRPHRTAMPRRNALKMILEHRGKWFADEITDRFASALGFYPPGSIVQLRSGSCAVILEPPSKSTWMAIRIDPESVGLKSKEINLHSLKDDYIVNEITPD